MQILTASDCSVLVVYGSEISDENTRAVLGLFGRMSGLHDPRIRNLHPAYSSLLIDFDPLEISHDEVIALVRDSETLDSVAPKQTRIVEIPVCYGFEFGPDLPVVAEHAKLSEVEVVQMHSDAEYSVAFLGFSPGFGYLSGLPAKLATPRLPTPRKSVPAGSVAIGGTQAAVYPVASPGGWQIIGRTPLRMFDPKQDQPTRLLPGDTVRFRPLSREQFLAYSE